MGGFPVANRAGLKSALSQADQIYVDSWLSDWNGFRSTLGDYVGIAHIPSMAMPWDPNIVRTTAILRFKRGIMDFQFSWNRETMTETLDGRGLVHDVILPAAAIGHQAIEVYEPVSGRTVHLNLKFASHLRSATVVR